MRNIFKKREEVVETMIQPIVPAVKKHEYPEVVTKIHKEFNSAGEKLLEDSLRILHECGERARNKGSLLQKIGFTNTNEAKKSEEMNDVEKMASKVKYYIDKYPNYKFITKDMVDQICNKYNLVCGEISFFKGFVPQDNLNEITAFKIDHKDIFKIRKSISTYESDKGAILNDEGKSAVNYPSIYDLIEEPVGFVICAPEKDMKVPNKYIRIGNFLEEKISIPDPIVLQAVTDGYLIVTAWGDEASDEIVQNDNK